MSIRKLTNAAYNVDTDWKDETESKDTIKKGWYNIKFSNMTSSVEGVIQAGSSIDINGVIYVFDTDETPAGTTAAGANYVITDGTTVVYTQSAPASYDYIKKGYYDGTGTKRYILMFDNTTFDNKRIMDKGEALYINNNITIDGNINGDTFIFGSRTSDPATPVEGQMWYRSDL